VLAVAECFQRVIHGCDRVAGRFQHDVDCRVRDQRAPVLADVRAPLLQGSAERSGAVLRGRPAGALEIRLGVRGIQVRDAEQVHAGRARHLRDVHGGELPGTDDPDAQRPPLRLALLQLGVEIHLRRPSAGRR